VKAIIQSWRTYRTLSSIERAVARDSAAGLAITWLGLRAFGFRRWKEFVMGRAGRLIMANSSVRSPYPSPQRIARLEFAAARNLFFKTNCLEQSLVLWSVLRGRGFSADLKIGARKVAGQFEAHAWVELDGRALNDESDSHRTFVPFDGAVTAVETQLQ